MAHTTEFSEIIIFLAIYSVVGWLCEVVYCSVPKKHFVNRGFLYGPYCPIYGVGAVFILMITLPFADNVFLVFSSAVIGTTVLEYITSVIMESLFQIRWWDYSKEKFNLNGRVCLKNSLLFGLLSLVLVNFVHPLVYTFIYEIPFNVKNALSSAVIVIFLVDMFFTLSNILKLTEKLKKIHGLFAEIESYDSAWFDRNNLPESINSLRSLVKNKDADEYLLNLLDKLETLVKKERLRSHFISSFPKLKHKEVDLDLNTLKEDLNTLRSELKTKVADKKESFENKLLEKTKLLYKVTVNSTKEKSHFIVSEINLYKLFWVFVVAGVLGYVIEIIYCIVTRGVLESRQGLIYGPFSQVYGLGAILMVIFLTPLAKKSDSKLFIGGAILGGLFEFICSFIQEKLFHTVSWEYSNLSFSIGGRTNLTYMFFWGFLGLIFIKHIYPKLLNFIEKIPKRQGKFFSYVILIFLIFDISISSLAVYRWHERSENISSSSQFSAFLDRQYPDEVLEKIYPNMLRVADLNK